METEVNYDLDEETLINISFSLLLITNIGMI